jgi:ubiquinone/menaquinone biosynthesis C-methylase UbiE
MPSERVVDERMRAYYDRRAPEYDDWLEGTGVFAARERPGWEADRDALIAALAALPPRRTLDVACGTAYLSRHLRGEVTGLDQSARMVEIARTRLAAAVQGEAVPLPFPDGAFERVATGHFYGHLREHERAAFLAEARRVAPELLVIDSAPPDGVDREEDQERVLNDGSRHRVYKRFFTPAGLIDELQGGEVVYDGRYFLAVLGGATMG